MKKNYSDFAPQATHRNARATSRPLTPAALAELQALHYRMPVVDLYTRLQISEHTLRKALTGRPLGTLALRYIELKGLPRLREAQP